LIYKISAGVILLLLSLTSFAQSSNVVLVEEFSETGCGACAQYDSAFAALMNSSADKVAVISYHCFYTHDPFFQYNKTGDQRYAFYQIKDGFPSAMVNGKKAGATAHLYFVKGPLIDSVYMQPAQFRIDAQCIRQKKNNINSAELKLKVISLKNNPSPDLRLFVAVTENNIDYKERYQSTSPNGITHFNHIMRSLLPDTNGILINGNSTGKVNKIKISYSNDDKEINFKEVQFVVFIQDMISKEVLGTSVVKESTY
jgi:hypothetical protein